MGTLGSAESHSWRDKRKCVKLTPKKADELFFPKPGGKSKAAKKYCESCPVINKCLDEAINLGLVGMWAGTTERERREMVIFIGSLDFVMPPEPTARTRRLRRIPVDDNILSDPLYGIDGPSDSEIFQLERKMYGL